MENNANKIVKFDTNKTDEHKSHLALQESVGGLATITDEKLAIISQKMVAIDRANNTAGRSETQTTNQLMTLTMLTDSPYRRLRQCLAQIEKKRGALDEAYFKMKKQQVLIKQWYEKGDEMSVLKAQEAEHGMMRNKNYGDLYIQAIVEVPVSLTKEQKNLLEQFKKLEDTKTNPSIKDFFGKAKRFWEN